MRPIATDQDAVRFPLNDLLGTGASVRLLRVLALEVSGLIGTTDAAEHTGLTVAGARRALKKLVRTGFVEQLGGGRALRFRFRGADPLAASIKALFFAEQDRYDHLISRLRSALGGLTEIQVAWIDAPPKEPGGPLHLGVLSDARSLSYLEDEIRRRIIEVEGEFDLTVEIHAFSRADLPQAALNDAVLLAGHLREPSSDALRMHEDRTARASLINRAISGRLERDSSLLNRAARHIEVMLEEDQGAAAHDLREWQDILATYSPRRIRDLLTSDTPRAQRLRQSSPFFAVLTAEEREALMDQLEDGG